MIETDKIQQQKEDIESIYSQIEADILKNNTDLQHSMTSLRGSINSSSSNSSNSSNSSGDYKSIEIDQEQQQDTKIAANYYCSCQEVIVSIDSQHCGLCDQVIPTMQQYQQERLQKLARIQQLKAQVNETQSSSQLNQSKIDTLHKQYINTQQAAIEMTDKIASLIQDIKIVQLKHKDEIAHTIAIEHSKKLVEVELHDLTQKLFEEANQMVLVEKEQKHIIQLQHDVVEHELNEAEFELKQVQLELDQLRQEMTEKDQLNTAVRPQSSSSWMTTTTHENYLLRSQLDMSSLLLIKVNNKQQQQLVEINDDYHQQVHDTCLLTEFQHFIDSMMQTGTSLSKLSTLPFMKSCYKSDIEPCLRFGLNPKISAKKITDAILVKTCLVEACPADFLQAKMMEFTTVVVDPAVKVRTSLWDRFSPSSSSSSSRTTAATLLTCQTCGRAVEEDKACWRFRISYFDEWSLIDRYCFDRIASVMEFYTFLRKLKSGVYKHVELFKIYQDCSKLKLQMFLSRMGALPALLDEFALDSSRIGSASP